MNIRKTNNQINISNLNLYIHSNIVNFKDNDGHESASIHCWIIRIGKCSIQQSAKRYFIRVTSVYKFSLWPNVADNFVCQSFI